MDSHTKDGHSKTRAVTWRVPKELREDTAGDFLDRMYLRTHAIGWAEYMELELEKWPNVPNEVRQQMTKAIHLVRRLYLHSFHLDDALQAETRVSRSAMAIATERASEILSLEMEVNRLKEVPLKFFCHFCETSTENTPTGHCSNCGSERIQPPKK